MSKRSLNLTGIKFGKLTVIELDKNKKGKKGQIYWVCKCECGNNKSILGECLKSGVSKHCGCSRKRKYSDPAMPEKNHIYSLYQCNAKKRNISFNLDFIDFINIIIQPCYYYIRNYATLTARP